MKQIVLLLGTLLLAGFVLLPAPAIAQITWDGGGDGTSWNDADNWNPGTVPTASDDVIIATGTPTLNVAATIQTLAMSGGTLGGTETLTISGLFTWSGGTINATSTINANGGITFSGVGQKTLNGTALNLGAASTWADGNIGMDDAAVIDILAGKTLTITDVNAASLLRTGVTTTEPVFNINGSLVKSAASIGITSIDVTTNNLGNTVDVQGGTMNFGFGSTHTGSINIASGATMAFDGNTHTLNAATVTGAGTMKITTGTLNLMGGQVIGSLFEIANGTVTNTGTTAVNGAMTWNAGTLGGSGTVTVNGGLSLGTGSTKTLGSGGLTLSIASASTWTDGGIAMGDAAVLDILTANTLTITDAGSASIFRTGSISTEPVFNINGTLTKNASSTGITSIDVTANNLGNTVDVQGGTMNFGFGSTHTGSITIASGATLGFDGNTHTLNAATVTGAGTLKITTGTLNLMGGQVLGSLFEITNGTVTNTGATTVNGALTWNAGTLGGSGTVTVNGGLSLETGSTKTLGSGGLTLSIASASTWTDGGIAMGDAAVLDILTANTLTITDAGSASIFRTGSISTEPVFNINGTLMKSASSTGITSVDVTANNLGNTVDVQGGQLDFGFGGTSTGSYTVGVDGVVEFDANTHTLIGASFSGAGITRVAGGTTNMDAATTLTSQLVVTGGTLTVDGLIAPSTFTQTNGTTGGAGNITVAGSMDWSAGTINGSGTVTANSGASFTTGSTKTLTGRTLDLAGPSTWVDGSIAMGDGAVLDIVTANTLTITDAGSASILRSGSISTEPVFNINGTMTKNASSTGITSIDVTTNNLGNTVDVQGGTMNFGFGSTHTGSITIASGATLGFDGNTHTLNAATVTGAGTLKVTTGTLNLMGGQVLGSLFEIANGTVTNAGATTVNGALTWNAGTINGTGTLTADGGLLFATGSTKNIGSGGMTLMLSSLSTWADGSISMADAAVLDIVTGDSLTVTDAGTASVFRTGSISTEPVFNINGTLMKSASSTGITSIDVTANNLGNTVDVQGGQLDFGFGGTSTGSYTVGVDGVVEFDANTHTLIGASFSGAGITRVAGGTTTMDAATTLTSQLVVTGGTLTVDGPIAPSTFTQTNGTTGGAGNITVAGSMDWSAGTINGSGTVTANSGASFTTGSTKTLTGRTLDLAGPSTWADGGIAMGDGAVLDIVTANTLTITDAGSASLFRTGSISTEPVFNINGTLMKSASSTGITSIDVTTNNSGNTVDVQGGTLNFGFGSTHTGSITIASGATMAFDANTHTLDGATVTGAGTMQITTGTLNLTGSPAMGTPFLITNGTVDNTGATTFTAPITWNAGTITGAGTVVADAGISLATGSTKNMGVGGATLNIAGPSTWVDGGISMTDAAVIDVVAGDSLTLTDTGSASIFRSGSITTEPVFSIHGVVTKSSASIGTTSIDVTVNNESTGVWNIDGGFQDLGRNSNNFGTITVASGAKLEYDGDPGGPHINAPGGLIQGEGTIDVLTNVTFTNDGAFGPGTSPGILTFDTDYDQTSGTSELNIELEGLTPGTEHDQLAVNGDATLGGTLNVSALNAYTPNDGDAFVILTTTGTVSGTFDVLNGLNIAPGVTLAPVYNATDVTLVASATAQEADLGVAKTVDLATANVGDTVTFTIALNNAGPSDATSITVDDLLPTGLTFSSASATNGAYDSGAGTWTLGSLSNGSADSLTIIATVTQAGLLTNTATIASSGQIDNNTTNNTSSASVTGFQVDIALSKTVDSATADVGSQVTFTVTASNNGPSDATGVLVTDAAPTGLTFDTVTPSAGTYDAGTGIWTLGALANGANATLIIVATVDQAGLITNTATVTGVDQPDTNAVNDTDSASVSGQEIDLAVTKTVDNDTPNVGDQVTFTVKVKNNGPTDATGVALTDAAPTGLTFDTVTPMTGTYDAGTGVWTLGSLVAGDSTSMTIVATVDQAGLITNTATITASDQVDLTPGNDTDSASVTGQQIDLALTKTVDNISPGVGDQVTFTVRVVNNGPSAATGVDITDAAPTGLSFDTVTPMQGTYDGGTGVWAVGGLAAGDSTSMTILATVNQAGSITNTATVTAADQPDSNASNDAASVTISSEQADLAVTKTADVTTVNVGDQTTFTVQVKNNGPSAATGVALTDSAPTGLTFGAVTPMQGTYDAGTGVWTLGDLAAGDSTSMTIVATVDQAGNITNTAAITATDQADPDTANNSADAMVTGVQVDVAVTKTVDNAMPKIGDQVTFTVIVVNNGPSDATGVAVTDAAPSGLTFDTVTTSRGSYDAGTGVWTLGSLSVNVPDTLTVLATVDQAGVITNTATVTAVDQPDADSSNDSASVMLSGEQADLAVTKTVDQSVVIVGDQVTFTVVVTNNGPTDATGVAVTDAAPTGLTFDTVTPMTGTYDGGTGVWTVGALAANDSTSMTILATVDSTGTITNTASVTASDQPDPNADNNTDSADVTSGQANVDADLAVTKIVDQSVVMVGDQVTFTVVVANNGPTDATGVAVTDAAPTGLTFDTVTPMTGTYDGGTGVWTVGALAANDSTSMTILATVDSTGTITNTASVTASDQPDPNADNNTDSADVTSDNVILAGTVFDLAISDSSGSAKRTSGLVQTPLGGAFIELIFGGAVVDSTTSAEDGTFGFDGLQPDSLYTLHFLATGEVPETGENAEVNLTVNDVPCTSDGEYVVPLTLAIQKSSLIFLLSNLDVDLASGIGDPIPLDQSYVEDEAGALLDGWLLDVGASPGLIVTSLERLTLAETVLAGLYEHAAILSHGSSSVLVDLVAGYVVSEHIMTGLLNELADKLGDKLPPDLKDRFIALIQTRLLRIFVGSPTNAVASLLSADYGAATKDAILTILEEAQQSDTDLFSNVDDELLRETLAVLGDQVFLSGLYVRETQEDLDSGVAHASAFEFESDFDSAQAATAAVLEEVWAAAGDALDASQGLQDSSNLDGTITTLLSLEGEDPTFRLLRKIARHVRRTEIAPLGIATATTLGALSEIQDVDAPQGVEDSFFPSSSVGPIATAVREVDRHAVVGRTGLQTPPRRRPVSDESHLKTDVHRTLDGRTSRSTLRKTSSNAVHAARSSLHSSVDDYRTKLQEIVTLATDGQRTDAIDQYSALLDLDEALNSDLLLAQAAVLAAAQEAAATDTSFTDAFGEMVSKVDATDGERMILYGALLDYADDDAFVLDTLSQQALEVESALDDADQTIMETTDLVADIAAPPIVVVSHIEAPTTAMRAGTIIDITATLEGAGDVDATDVTVTLEPDSSGVVVGTEMISIGTLSPGVEQTVSWQVQIVDSTRTTGTILVKLGSSNARVIDGVGSYLIETAQITAVGDTPVLPRKTALAQNYPNPFGPSTTITYTLTSPRQVRLAVYDLLGRHLATLVDSRQAPGAYEVVFDAGRLPSGMYFYVMRAGDFVRTRQMILVK